MSGESAADYRGARPAPGREMLSSEFVERHKRRRFVAAVAEIAHEFGIAEVTATAVCRLAHSARNTFYELFASSSDACAYAFGEAFERIFGPVSAAAQAGDSWLAEADGAVAAFLSSVAAEPLLAELCLVHCFGKADESAGHDYQSGVEVLSEVFRGGREVARLAQGDGYHEPPAISEDYLARVVVSLAALRVRRGEAVELPQQRAEMVRLVAGVILGAEEAGRAWRGFLTASVPVDV